MFNVFKYCSVRMHIRYFLGGGGGGGGWVLSLILLSCHNLVMAKGRDLFVSTVHVYVQL